jgi:hypothetical protein
MKTFFMLSHCYNHLYTERSVNEICVSFIVGIGHKQNELLLK